MPLAVVTAISTGHIEQSDAAAHVFCVCLTVRLHGSSLRRRRRSRPQIAARPRRKSIDRRNDRRSCASIPPAPSPGRPSPRSPAGSFPGSAAGREKTPRRPFARAASPAPGRPSRRCCPHTPSNPLKSCVTIGHRKEPRLTHPRRLRAPPGIRGVVRAVLVLLPELRHKCGESFVQPEVGPVLARHQIAEPLVPHLVRDQPVGAFQALARQKRDAAGRASSASWR